MRPVIIIAGFLLTTFCGKAQVVFKTVLPSQPVVAGESFQVQYILDDAEKITSFTAPEFKGFRKVSGPNTYSGSIASLNKARSVKNTVYTLMALRPGRFLISGATAEVNGKKIRSNDGMVEIIPKEKKLLQPYKQPSGINENYFLRPGEDPYEKIRKNLFVKVTVDRKSCYVGEPVQALFQLYSRLESWSDIVKNPGFYGFTVHDLLNLANKQVATEIINGKAFDVHIIRKVLLYPLQAGTFTIDPMEVKNKVEFSRSAVNKKTEQEIVEGVLGHEETGIPVEGTETFETDLRTEPVKITVKPLPEKNKPGVFNGAVGHFIITGSLLKKQLAKNEEGFLEITIVGKGNFIQLSPPAVQWPAGVEGFEPGTKDMPVRSATSRNGKRVFRYPFVCAVAGTFQIPAISFSFFNTDSNNYKTISTGTLLFSVSNEEKRNSVVAEKKESIAEISSRAGRNAAGVVIGLVLIVVAYWVFHKKKQTPVAGVAKPQPPSVEETLEPAGLLLMAEGNEFYLVLHQSIWSYLNYHVMLEGSGMNKDVLAAALEKRQIESSVINNLRHILAVCESGMYTKAELEDSKTALLQEAGKILEKLRLSLL